MSIEANKALFRRLIEEVINTGNLHLADRFVSPKWVDNMESVRAVAAIPGGLEGFKRVFEVFREGFPDFHYTIDDMVAEGDKVAVLVTARGTHKGNFLGFAPTGRKVALTHTNILRIVDGKFVECWGASTMRGLLEKIGVILAAE